MGAGNWLPPRHIEESSRMFYVDIDSYDEEHSEAEAQMAHDDRCEEIVEVVRGAIGEAAKICPGSLDTGRDWSDWDTRDGVLIQGEIAGIKIGTLQYHTYMVVLAWPARLDRHDGWDDEESTVDEEAEGKLLDAIDDLLIAEFETQISEVSAGNVMRRNGAWMCSQVKEAPDGPKAMEAVRAWGNPNSPVSDRLAA